MDRGWKPLYERLKTHGPGVCKWGPLTAHEGVPTRGQLAFKHTQKDPHSLAAGPQLDTEGSAPAVRAP